MKFKHGTRRRALEYEKDWAERWKADGTFERSVENRPEDNAYVFYDGPPFITGVPHHGTLLSSIVKDAVPRYWTMKGKRVERVWGWDCHGLPAENFVEKQLNITDRRQIVAGTDAAKDSLKFTPELTELVKKGEKTSTFRYGAKNLAVGDVAEFITRHDKSKTERFGYARIKGVKTFFLRDLPLDYEGHEPFDSREAQLKTYKGYYGDEVTLDSQFTVYDFEYLGENLVQAPLDKDGNELPTITLEHYITKARESMVANSATWEGVIDRVGRWVDFKGAYRTMDKNFMESVWWAFKELYKAGKIYEDKKVLMYDTKFASPVSKNEVTMDNDAYQTVTDPSLYVKFKVEQAQLKAKKPLTFQGIEGDIFLLAWTTTPWTLPANMALAVNAEMTYCLVAVNEEVLVIAKECLDRVLRDENNKPIEHYSILKEVSGTDLQHLRYQQPIIEVYGGNTPKKSATYCVAVADFVSADSGTGIVHIAPAYGEDDYKLKQDFKRNALDIDDVLDDNGFYRQDVASKLYKFMPWRDSSKPLECWEANKDIAKGLMKAGVAWRIEYIRHEYPFNPRSGQRIMYRAIPSWFFDVQDSKPLMLEQNENINWFPPHLKHGRFAKNIEQAPDWNLSRDRFWATAMPVWKGDRGTVKVIGSYEELKELSGVELDDYHRPWVDDITFEIDGETFTRIDKVLDCWFESGSMPFAQLHYPFENKAKFEANYPADFIVEYVGQVRAWFYYVHVVNTALFGDHAFNNVITTGVVAGNDGRKMSKSLGNFTDPNELMDKFSADSLRFLLLGSPLLNGEDFALQDKDVGDVARKLSMVWNMYDFFTMYAEVDDFKFPYDTSSSDAFLLHSVSNTAQSDTPDSSSRTGTKKSFAIEVNVDKLKNPLDVWIVSRIHQLVTEVEKHMDAYNIPDAISPILPFLDDASNWYVRRSRRRFWKSEDDSDKNDAYKTLHYVLVRLAYVLAPFTPFLAEELYHNLTGDSESIHLKDWLPAGHINELVTHDMDTVRNYVNEGLSLRAKAGLKVRQPLASITVLSLGQHIDFESILTDELNVKAVKQGKEIAIDENITPELKREGLMREVIRHVQSARKAAGLNVDDRITLSLLAMSDGAPDLRQAIEEHSQTIAEETLTESFADVQDGYSTAVKIEGMELQIALKKAL